jgi:hypothetical protein
MPLVHPFVAADNAASSPVLEEATDCQIGSDLQTAPQRFRMNKGIAVKASPESPASPGSA